MTVIEAPSVNFATRTTRTVTPVTKPPRPLRALFTQCGPRFFRQCMTMADCESLNARNPPTAYREIGLSVTPLKTTSKKQVRTARTTMPQV
jgi:hypothetical protein